MKYSPELIRQLEDPEYAKKADEYERQARSKHKSKAVSEKVVEEKPRQAKSVQTEDVVVGRRAAKKQAQKKSKKYKINYKIVLRNVAIVCLVFIVGVCGVVWSLTGTFDRQDTSKADFGISEKAAKELKGYRNIAIFGTDGRADESYDVSRTDAIIVLSFEKLTGDLKMISIMRDSYFKFEYFDGTMILDKVTHANVYGGAVNTCAAINRSLDLNIDEYVMFNWKAVSDAVDTLGGIEINVKESELRDLNKWGPETAENVGGTFKEVTEPGKQTLDGVQATTYCRIRKTSGGDSGRTSRYKKVVVATIKKAITQPGKLKDLSENVFPNIRTNLTQKDILTLMPLVLRMDMESGISWPKEYYAGLLSDGVAYVVPITLESEVKRLHKKAFEQKNYQLSEEAAAINEEIIWSTGIQ